MNEEEARQKIDQLQHYQQQLQSILIQKETMHLQLFEMEKALEELGANGIEKAYKIVGQVMVSKPVEELKKELSESKEAFEIKIKSLEGMEQKTMQKLENLRDELQKMVK